MRNDVVALPVQNIFEDGLPAGAFCFKGLPVKTQFQFVCPCGCGQAAIIPVYRVGEPKPAPNAWTWDGNLETPTLAPSIRDMAGCKFHGHLRGGFWSFEADSGQAVTEYQKERQAAKAAKAPKTEETWR
jgi:hypothetical protein